MSKDDKIVNAELVAYYTRELEGVTTLYPLQVQRAASGMTRWVRVFFSKGSEVREIRGKWNDLSWDYERGAYKFGGCGYSATQDAVEMISWALRGTSKGFDYREL